MSAHAQGGSPSGCTWMASMGTIGWPGGAGAPGGRQARTRWTPVAPRPERVSTQRVEGACITCKPGRSAYSPKARVGAAGWAIAASRKREEASSGLVEGRTARPWLPKRVAICAKARTRGGGRAEAEEEEGVAVAASWVAVASVVVVGGGCCCSSRRKATPREARSDGRRTAAGRVAGSLASKKAATLALALAMPPSAWREAHPK
mmetsp:Transcript_48091/g.133308  ORF Transcript_48091/g.133308 Transcript_48091/m.133308 type:complete len:205 (-) Transcript_48091:427-1041(-)